MWFLDLNGNRAWDNTTIDSTFPFGLATDQILTGRWAPIGVSTSTLYANNLVSFLKELLEDGDVDIDLENETIRDPLVCRGGEVTNERIREALS